jgi:anti-sigma factor RsiW
MKCSQFLSGLFAYREGTLSGAQTEEYAQHHALCSDCREALAQFDRFLAAVDAEKSAAPNPFQSTRTLAYLDSRVAGPGMHSSRVLIRIMQPVALAMALAVGIFIGSYHAGKQESTTSGLQDAPGNVEFLKTNLFITEFTDGDKILVLNLQP